MLTEADNTELVLDENKLISQLSKHLYLLYPEQADQLVGDLLDLARQYFPENFRRCDNRWSEEDILLISYGDNVHKEDEAPLKTLHDFANSYLKDTINCIHILPFFPYSSDDGFSVIDFRQVNPELGDWDHIKAIAKDFKLMADLVINHVSRESLWFYDYVGNIEPACDYFIELPPETDVSKVTRPRNSPLLVPVNTHRGTRHLWATFSEDQIDLNFSNPDVLIEFVDIFLGYLQHGAKLIRLDAIAFLWKELDTSCIHLSQTHEVVKLLRTFVDHLHPESILLTETNVPHEENISYFGNGDEAHMVYQFPLPPLLLHALNRGTSVHLYNWASQLPALPQHSTYLNFTASHDGIGLRALEGIISQREVDDLLDCMHRFGGYVSMKSNQDGEDSPYEINISLFDAMQGTRRGPDQWQIQRFLCSQAIMFSLQGIPAVYFNSLTATPNDLLGVEVTGRTRSINRKKWPLDDLKAQLDAKHTPNHEVFNALKDMMKIRKTQTGFHPDASQVVLDTGNSVFALLRRHSEDDQRVLALHNVTAVQQAICFNDHQHLLENIKWLELFSQQIIENTAELTTLSLQPYQVMWLSEVKE